MSVVVPTAAPAASPCASGQSHPGRPRQRRRPGRLCAPGDASVRGQPRLGPRSTVAEEQI